MSKKNEDGKIFQKIDPWMADDPDIAKAGPLADCLHYRALVYCRRNLTNKVPKRCFPEVSYGFPERGDGSAKKILASFLESGLWIWREEEGCWEIRNYYKKYNMTEDAIKERSKELSKNGSRGMHNRWHSPDNPNPDCSCCVKEGWV